MRHLIGSLIFFAIPFSLYAQAPGPSPTQPAQDVPVIDGGAGPCSVDLTVLDASGAPVFSAMVKVHIAYGFHGLHKLDLSAYTNAQGRTKFKGLPARAYKPPVEFQASKDALTGMAAYNPEAECEARHEIVVKNGK
jgi:hypothetical protein